MRRAQALAGTKKADKCNQCEYRSLWIINLRNHIKIDHKQKRGWLWGGRKLLPAEGSGWYQGGRDVTNIFTLLSPTLLKHLLTHRVNFSGRKFLYLFFYIIFINAETIKICQYCSFIFWAALVFVPIQDLMPGRNNISIISNIDETPFIFVVFLWLDSNIQKPTQKSFN